MKKNLLYSVLATSAVLMLPACKDYVRNEQKHPPFQKAESAKEFLENEKLESLRRKAESVHVKSCEEYIEQALKQRLPDSFSPPNNKEDAHIIKMWKQQMLAKMSCLIKEAERGNLWAMKAAGEMCYRDWPAQDYNEAYKWFQRAAQKGGDPAAMFYLGAMCYYGQGIKQDYQEALQWFRKAAERNDASAQYYLGTFFYYGTDTIRKDPAEAVRLLQKCVERQEPDAQCLLGIAYYEGQGVKRNPQKAAELFRGAANRNNARAKYYLGLLYYEGEAFKKDENQAEYWFNESISWSWRDCFREN